MKTLLNFTFIFVLILSSCSKEINDSNELNDSDISIDKRSYEGCLAIEEANCVKEFEFPIKDPNVNYFCFTVYYLLNMTPLEIHCLRYAFFNCYPELRMDSEVAVPTEYEEIWCIPAEKLASEPTGQPGKTLSKTIKSDPRIITDRATSYLEF